MDEKLILTVLVYIFIVGTAGGFLPDDLFSDAPEGNSLESQALTQSYNTSYAVPENPVSQISFFKKMLTVLFIPFTISGVPLVFSAILAFMNYLSAFLGGVYVYDKIRGI